MRWRLAALAALACRPDPNATGGDTVPDSNAPAMSDPVPKLDSQQPDPAADAGSNGAPDVDAPDPGPSDSGSEPRDESLPPWSSFSAAVRSESWSRPARASRRVWLSDIDAAAVMRTERGSGAEVSWRIQLVRLQRGGDGTWVANGVHSLDEWSAHEMIERDGTIAAFLDARDVDDDGEPELIVRWGLSWMCCGAGQTEKRTLAIVNAGRELSEAAFVELDEIIYRGGTRSKESFEDRNDDGHPDLIIDWTSTDAEDPTTTGTVVHTWRPGPDRFDGAERPESCACE